VSLTSADHVFFPEKHVFWQQIVSASNRSYVSSEHMKILKTFYRKENVPRNPPYYYGNPSSEKLKTIHTHMLPDMDFKKHVSEKTFS